jgi:LAO/AO transport system kinase
VDDLAARVVARDRTAIGRAITLVESQHDDDAEDAQRLLAALLPHTGSARRVGMTGVPGVGKSTLIETLGLHLLGQRHRVAVLAVDPSSTLSGGSILGDRTRMTTLSRELDAFIRPSPTAGSLGGVTQRTRESMIVCEAAGFDVVIVETVGVGQSETLVAEMVDCFLVLVLPGSGDELQGIKRGILELAHVVAINKADGDARAAADRTRQAHAAAMQLLRPAVEGWKTPVVTVSAIERRGVPELWGEIERFFAHLSDTGELDRRRRTQRVSWMWSAVDDAWRRALRSHPAARPLIAELEREVEAGRLTALGAARRLLDAAGIGPDRT